MPHKEVCKDEQGLEWNKDWTEFCCSSSTRVQDGAPLGKVRRLPGRKPPISLFTIILFPLSLLALLAFLSKLVSSLSSFSDLHSNLQIISFSRRGVPSSSLASSQAISSGDMYSSSRTCSNFLFFSLLYDDCLSAPLRDLSFYKN